MQKHIEDAILAGTAVALRSFDQQDLIEAAFDEGFTVFSPIEPGRSTFTWANSFAKKANDKSVRGIRSRVRLAKA